MMTELCEEIEGAVAARRLAAEHGIGELQDGGAALVIAVAPPHPAEAFSVSRVMIDRHKERVPTWKKEQDHISTCVPRLPDGLGFLAS